MLRMTIYISVFISFAISFYSFTTDKAPTIKFIERFDELCQVEAAKYGQPASVKLAQSFLETGYGKSYLSGPVANNFFGIKCHQKNCLPGHCTKRKDDSPNDKFVNYQNAWYSFRAHSELMNTERYRPCHKSKNYKQWCQCLQESGYAGISKTYADKLIKIIETYKLYELD